MGNGAATNRAFAELEAFHQATLANDIAGAMRLIAGNGMPLYFRGVTAPVVQWLSSLTHAVLNTYAICLTLDMAIGSDFSWWSLTGADIFERQTQSKLLKRRIDEGFSFGLSKQDIVGGITEALSIWSNAEDWAENLFAQLERDSAQAWDDDWDEESEEDSGEDSERGGLTDLETDCHQRLECVALLPFVTKYLRQVVCDT